MSQATFIVSFFEIYGGRCHDLFNNRTRLNILEDGNGNIIISGITEQEVRSEKELNDIIEYGNSVRTTHSTVSNSDSSRSHAICRITLV
jgi:kinesin family protein 2/24